MRSDEMRNYNFVVFDKPEVVNYDHPDGGRTSRMRVPVKKSDSTLLGYLPLPSQYLDFWKQLCYTIVYHKEMQRTMAKISRKKEPGTSRDLSRSLSAILKYQLYSRGLIIEDIFAQKGMDIMRLHTFDEYIIKERFDLHWVPAEALDFRSKEPASWIGASPFNPDVDEVLRECDSNIFIPIFIAYILLDSGLSRRETVPRLLAPNDWDWKSLPFNVAAYAKRILTAMPAKDDPNDIKPDYVHGSTSTVVYGWQDYAFRWLTKDEDAAFERPGPAVGRRSERVLTENISTTLTSGFVPFSRSVIEGI